jgi:NAD+ diphosphatase
VASLLGDPDARAVLVQDDTVLVSANGRELARFAVPQPAGHTPLLLGLESGRALFGVDLDWLDARDRERHATESHRMSLRDAALTLWPPESGLAAYLVALANWHRHHRHCANCGSVTEATEGGLVRHCPRCGRSHFPRTDPVVIMTVEAEGQLLLGRRAIWPAGRYSLLAGFVAPGETPEEAVSREVREESGIEVMSADYVASQPWPFPASLMLGYSAQSRGGIPRCLDGELEDVRWFTRDEVMGASQSDADWSSSTCAQSSQLLLPSRVSIARSLIDWWLREPTANRPE